MNKKKLLLALTLSGAALFSSMNLNAGIPVSPEYLSKTLDSIRTTPDLWAKTCTAGHDLTKGCSTADLSMTASSEEARYSWVHLLQATGLADGYGVTAEHMINSGSTFVIHLSGEDFGRFGPTVSFGGAVGVEHVELRAFTVVGSLIWPLVNSQGHDMPVYPHHLEAGEDGQYSPVAMFDKPPERDVYMAFTAFNDQGDPVKLPVSSIQWRQS